MTRVRRGGFALSARVDHALTPDAGWIVLSNSLAADHGMWDPQVPMLTRTHNVLRYDTRGHGASGTPPPPYGFDDLVEDVIAVMDAHGVAKAVFMGLSLGGMTGLGLALEHPERVEALICCNARADAPPPFVKGWQERLAAIGIGGMAAIVPGTMERWFGAGFRASHPQLVERFSETIRSMPTDGYRGCAAALMELDYKRHLGRISLPSLFVAGANDLAAPPETMQEMAAAVPDAKFALLPDASHISNVENASAFNTVVAELLAGLPALRN